jgi:hypothetical protein
VREIERGERGGEREERERERDMTLFKYNQELNSSKTRL